MNATPLPQAAPAAKSDARRLPGFWARFVWFAPAVAVLLAVTLYPTAVVLWLSVHRTRLYEVVHGVGFANYLSVITSPTFLELSRNSLLYVFGALAVVLPMGLASALALQNIARGAVFARTLLLLPWTLSMGVVGCFWLWLLNPSYGPMSYLMRSLGVEPGLMLGDPSLALLLVILVTAWWSFPYVMVMMSAALQSVPAELYEAIEMDGGGLRERLRHAVWPHIAPTLGSTALALSILYLTLITLILVLTGGGPLGETAAWYATQKFHCTCGRTLLRAASSATRTCGWPPTSRTRAAPASTWSSRRSSVPRPRRPMRSASRCVRPMGPPRHLRSSPSSASAAAPW